MAKHKIEYDGDDASSANIEMKMLIDMGFKNVSKEYKGGKWIVTYED